ncbi:MAG: hypothetical protein HN576_02565 [Bacteriovoracaceae bacterium]|jgi:hypothetical protein|nr:hypothetical protein [Bacteriovoracaceae bacterium]
MSDSNKKKEAPVQHKHKDGHDNGHHAVKVVQPKMLHTQQVNDNQLKFSTWMLLIGLIFAFVILKSFIYIKDEKRHGK